MSEEKYLKIKNHIYLQKEIKGAFQGDTLFGSEDFIIKINESHQTIECAKPKEAFDEFCVQLNSGKRFIDVDEIISETEKEWKITPPDFTNIKPNKEAEEEFAKFSPY